MTIRYVAGNGSAGVSGTNINQPTTYANAISLSTTPGDEIRLLDSGGAIPFSGATLTASGTAMLPIVVMAQPGHSPFISLTGSHKVHANYWIFDGLSLTGFSSIAFIVGQSDAIDAASVPDVLADYITFQNMYFADADRLPIDSRRSDHLLIQYSTFERCRPGATNPGNEINAVGLKYWAPNSTIQYCTFRDIGSDGVHVLSFGYVAGHNATNFRILHNLFTITRPYYGTGDPEFGQFQNVGENGVDVKWANGGEIAYNVFENFRQTVDGIQDASGANGDGCVIHNSAKNIKVHSNLFNNNTIGLTVSAGSQDQDDPPSGIEVYNNVFTNQVVENSDGGWGLGVTNCQAGSVFIYHNTFANNASSVRSWTSTNVIMRNNLFYNTGSERIGSDSTFTSDHNCWYNSPANEQSGTGDITANPQVDANYRPLSNSPLIGAGTNVGVTLDKDGNVRSAPVDIGAYEFVVVSGTPVYNNDPDLVLYLPLDETTGTRFDFSGRGNHLTPGPNGVGYSTNKIRGDHSADFERDNNQYLSRATLTDFDWTQPFTILGWFWFEALYASETQLFSVYNTAGNRAFRAVIQEGTNYFKGNASTNGQSGTVVTALGATSLQAQQWYHLAFRWDGAYIALIIDAQIDTNGAQNPLAFTGPPYPGSTAAFVYGGQDGGSFQFDGLGDEFIVINRALTLDEIQSIRLNGLQDPPAAGAVRARIGNPFAMLVNGGLVR